MAAAGHGNVDAIYNLLCGGAKINLKSKNGWNSLKYAEIQNQPDVVIYLREILLKNPEEENLSNENKFCSEEKREILDCYLKHHDDEHIDFKLLETLIFYIHENYAMTDSVLVFLPGYEEIVSMKERLNGKF